MDGAGHNSGEDRLGQIVDLLRPLAGDRSMFVCRAFKAASAEIGWPDADRLRSVCRAVNRKGSFGAYLDWRREPPAFAEFTIAPMSGCAMGNVYLARVERYPHVIKIGFTRDPERRMRQLRAETGEPHRIEKVIPGTLFDEALMHIAHFGTHIVREWFFDPETTDRSHPAFLPLGTKELLKLLGDAA